VTSDAEYFSNHDRRLKFPWSLYHRGLSRRMARALDELPQPRPRVLVVGCGLEPFVPGAERPEYYGVDLDANSVATCSARFPEMKDRLAACPSPYELPQQGAFSVPFDAIVAKEVIEHLDDPERWVRTLAGALAAGGELLLTTPNYGRWSTLPLLEATLLELVARRDGYSRKHLHPSRFDERRFRELSIAPDVRLVAIETTRTGWALFGRWRKDASA